MQSHSNNIPPKKQASFIKKPADEPKEPKHQDDPPEENPDAPKNQSQTDRPQLLFSWEAEEYEKFPRTKNWYIGMFLLFLVLIGYALFTDNLLMSILFILAGASLYLFEMKNPQTHAFGVTFHGVLAQNKIFEFSSLESFWIYYEPHGEKILSLKSKKNFLPFTHIPLGQADPVVLREALLQFIPEVEQTQSLSDSLNGLF